ncbi:hypothetical protein B0H19DRAFT_1098677 [Mycena capillaripes]|nr:hypothetical protein B0H19DRAFT_1098677 [Mycena capillaripes]
MPIKSLAMPVPTTLNSGERYSGNSLSFVMITYTPAPAMYSLPDELLELIVAAGQEGRVPSSQGAFKSEWTLSHVSRRLREVIVGAPTLWAFVEGRLEAEGAVEILKLYLERSGRCNIWAALRIRADVKNLLVMEQRLRLVVPHIHRIWRLTLMLRTMWGRHLLAPFRDIAAPNLQHLEIVTKGVDSPLELFSSGAPRLTFFKMDGFIPIPVPPWMASLTHLEIRNPHLVDQFLVQVIARCSLLAHLYLDLTKSSIWDSRFCIPSLNFVHLSISNSEDQFYLRRIVDLFDTLVLTEFRIDGAHGNQISALFSSTSLPHASFPALSTFSFVNTWCPCRIKFPFLPTISSPPLQLFPALSSLTLIKECYMGNIVDEILGSASQPWPLLNTVKLYPMDDDLEDVRDALLATIRTKRQRGEPLPKFGFSAALLSLEDWQESGADVEMFDI